MIENFTYYGYWRLPESNESHRGIVSFSKDRSISLKLFESYMASEDQAEIPFILGDLANGSKLTLYKCYEITRMRRFPGVGNSEYEALYCFKNVHFDDIEKLRFNKIRGRFQFLNKWWNKRGYKSKVHENGSGVDVVYVLPEKTEIELDEGSRAQIYYRFTSNLLGIDDSLSIKQLCYFGIETRDKTDFLDLLGSLLHFQNLLTLVCFEPCHPLSIEVVDNSESEAKFIEVVYKTGFKYDKEKKIPRGRFLFYNDEKSDKLVEVIRNWYAMRERIAPVFRLIMLSFYYVEVFHVNQFLNLCQALETFHSTMRERRNICLKKRLRNIVEELPKSLIDIIIDDKEGMLQRIVDSRNYYTHYNPNKKARAISETECYGYSMKLKFMLVILMVKELGFGQKKLEEIIGFCSWSYFRAADIRN